MKRLLAVLAIALLALLPSLAAADGEAAVVIDWGDGSVSTHCVAFQGDSITGDQLLARAGYNVNDFSSLVCAIGGTGCQHAGTGASCLCECPGGGADCTYWAFFTRAVGAAAWQYSSIGYSQQQVRQGEMHGWRWGQGSGGPAQPPPNISFQSVCTPPPPPTQAPTATTAPPAPTATSPAATTPAPAPTATATATTTAIPTPTPTGSTATPSTAPGDPTPGVGDTPTSAVPALSVDPVSTIPPGATPTLGIPAAPAAGDGGSDGPGAGTVAAFGATALVLIAAIVAGVFWRRKHDH